MSDKRIEKLASILVGHSINVKKNDTVMIVASSELAKPLVLECYKEVLKRGGHPQISVGFEECSNIFLDNASKAQIEHLPKTKVYESKNIDCYINIRAPLNKKALSTVDPKKAGKRAMTMMSISTTIVNKNRWVLTNFPTNALAQEADMSLVEYENFLYGATNIDWATAEKAQTKLKRILDKGKTVHIVGKETDLTLSIKGRPGIKCCGHRNMPDGEVFLSPIENSAEGHIFYEMPAIYQAREVTGIRLTFKKGKVVEASADKNEDFLIAMLDTDKGGRFLGELGIATNYGIKNFSSDILFDEKIGGTVHLAVGRSYEEAKGTNKSAIHWDMIKDLRSGGRLYVDGKLIQKNGKFLI